jgi:single-stranded-DNA-specific exonuclease
MMPITYKRWNRLNERKELALTLQNELKIHPILCQILAQRGITDFNAAKSFFRPTITDIHAPWLMKGMEVAVTRILEAIDKKEKILIYGDYDVDGTTAVAIVFDFIDTLFENANLEYYIPNRYKEGYGLSKKGVDYAVENGFKLLITLDCGIKSSELILEAKNRGVDTIICDHHLPGKDLPKAVAILNAKQDDCGYPYKELCGCGVGFKLIHAIALKKGFPENSYLKYLELVATAIAADIVPITGENRLLTYHGLKQVNASPSIGIKALIELSELKGPVNISSLGFMIGPRINAAGRMDDAKKAVALFIEKDPSKALYIASLLQTDNNHRKEADKEITKDAISMIEENHIESNKKSTVLYSPEWHKGVIGIVASRLLERFYKPTIIFTKSGDVVAGSARSIPGFNIHEGLEQCRELLIGFGGHYFAAGMTLLPENIEAFKNKFEKIVDDTLEPHHFIPEIHIDAEVLLSDLTPMFFNIMQQMEPFGPENAKPIFCATKVKNAGSRIVKENHVRFQVEQNGTMYNGIGFNLAEKYNEISDQSILDLVFTLEENTFNGQTSLQLKVIDVASTYTNK